MSFHFRCVLISPNEILPKLCFSKTSSFVTHVEAQRAVVKGIFYFVRCALLLHTLWKWKWASGFIIVAHLLLQLQFTCEEEGLPVELKMDNRISCGHCPKTFTGRQGLSYHKLTHIGKKKHICPQCNKSFIKAGSLNKHLLIHTGEKPHKCTQCNYSSNQVPHLREHIMKHTGKKPYHCNQCEYTTITSGHLKQHERTHSGEKPHRCTLCEFSSIQNSNLKRHINNNNNTHIYFSVSCFM